jgi:hypothetical protein
MPPAGATKRKIVRSHFCRNMKVPAPDARFDLMHPGSFRLRDPISSCLSRSIEVLPELRRHCAAHDLSSVRLINADFIAEADFYFG